MKSNAGPESLACAAFSCARKINGPTSWPIMMSPPSIPSKACRLVAQGVCHSCKVARSGIMENTHTEPLPALVLVPCRYCGWVRPKLRSKAGVVVCRPCWVARLGGSFRSHRGGAAVRRRIEERLWNPKKLYGARVSPEDPGGVGSRGAGSTVTALGTREGDSESRRSVSPVQRPSLRGIGGVRRIDALAALPAGFDRSLKDYYGGMGWLDEDTSSRSDAEAIPAGGRYPASTPLTEIAKYGDPCPTCQTGMRDEGLYGEVICLACSWGSGDSLKPVHSPFASSRPESATFETAVPPSGPPMADGREGEVPMETDARKLASSPGDERELPEAPEAGPPTLPSTATRREKEAATYSHYSAFAVRVHDPFEGRDVLEAMTDLLRTEPAREPLPAYTELTEVPSGMVCIDLAEPPPHLPLREFCRRVRIRQRALLAVSDDPESTRALLISRLLHRRRRPPPNVDHDGHVRFLDAVHRFPFRPLNPLRENRFRSACRAFAEERDSREPDIRRAQKSLDVAFGIYCHAIGAKKDDAPLRYDKKAADVALRGAIGSVGQQGNRIFRYPNLPKIDMNDDLGAARAFGIYMARKAFFAPDPTALPECAAKMVARITAPAPDPFPELRNRMVAMAARIARLMMVRTGWVPPFPSSGKSCRERSRALGGKRMAIVENDDPVPGVRIQPIMSAGKPRGICLHSYKCEEYAALNGLMLDGIRNCAWLVTGRTTAQWVEQCQLDWFSNEWDTEEWYFCSGDLQAATDNFSGRFAEAMIREVWACIAPWTSLPVEHALDNCISAHLFMSGADGIDEYVGRQQRGQLLSSDVSFPVLCVIGFISALVTNDDFDAVEALQDDEEFVDAVREYKKCGVNGDDIVIFGRKSIAEVWSEVAVPATGGVPEPTKSPCDTEFFTINSQLWRRRPGGLPYQINAILPAMLLHLNEKAAKAPHESWASLMSSPLLTAEAYDALAIDLCLFPELPIAWGGLGMHELIPESPTAEDLNLFRVRALWALESRGRPWTDLRPQNVPPRLRPILSLTSTGVTFGCPSAPDTSSRPVTGFLPRSLVKHVLQDRFMDPNVARWTNLGAQAPSADDVAFRVRVSLASNRISAAAFLEEARALYPLESDGEVYVEDFDLPEEYAGPAMTFENPQLPSRQYFGFLDRNEDRTQAALSVFSDHEFRWFRSKQIARCSTGRNAEALNRHFIMRVNRQFAHFLYRERVREAEAAFAYVRDLPVEIIDRILFLGNLLPGFSVSGASDPPLPPLYVQG
ncbi:putative RNA-dependent RNA polymerase [Rhizoctonia solani ourmia-like virus 4]|uniref:RNA-dependent RNA polymerase n=1 Tax=Rhizoctonia solani ourmia-like virus 4 TaxID=2599430 RepID=A0ABX5Y3U6_9VIRU|nr:putative RNA-dependent RNA polymerase [Rhizoctonia solani ourmia-like virus 4]QDW65429.1 putative RNA-dependent RNA polymerase [Rhizoctonia solani ourmia-like virus 4]